MSSTGSPTAILLPENRRVADTVAILCARLMAPTVRRDALDVLTSLANGHRVRVLPDEGVYFFDGVADGGVWLRLADIKNVRTAGRMWIPMKEATRIEPTIRKRPMGTTGRKDWRPNSPTMWDAFSHADIFGNAALTDLAVVLIGSRSDFRGTLDEQLGFAAAPNDIARAVGEGLPWGEIDEEGAIRILSPAGASGSPLIALARDHASAKRFTATRPPGSLAVISGRADDALADRTSVESIAERQRYLLVAPGRLRQDLAPRRSNGWTVVELSGSAALNADVTGVSHLDRLSMTSAWMQSAPSVLAEPSRSLEAAFAALDIFGRRVEAHLDADEDVAECAHTLREIFFDVSDWLDSPSAEDLAHLDEGCDFVTRHRRRLTSVVGESASSAAMDLLASVREFTESVRTKTTPKGDCLLRLASLAHRGGSYRQLVVVGHGQTAKTVTAFLDQHGCPMTCVTPTELARTEPVDRVNVMSMMRREAFARLVDPWAAPNLMFIGYRHEIDIYQRRLTVREAQIRQLSVNAQAVQRFPILGRWLQQTGQEPELPVTDVEPSAPVARPVRQPQPTRPGELVRAARFCRFSGNSWMAVTDDHSFARVQADATKAAQISTVEGRDLQIGDLILVREGSEKDIVREAAELRLGRDAYVKLRQRADLWRDALKQSGLGADALRTALAEQGLDRGIPTIRYWLADVGPIGPSDPSTSIPLIAAALGKEADVKPWASCIDAVQAVRRLHVEAGFRLTQMLLAECGQSVLEHSEYETPFELSMGTVWLLEVEQLEARRSDWPTGQINRIVWESESWRRRLLARNQQMSPIDLDLDELLSEFERQDRAT
jgi:hypothetical protein